MGATKMIHHECFVCGVTATGVHNATMLVAWSDHMDIHEPDDAGKYGSWTWLVERLPGI